MLIVLVWAGAPACTPTEHLDRQPPHETTDEMNAKITKDMEAMDKEQAQKEKPGPTDFQSIADILGCMFAPGDCIPAKRKEERKLDR